MSKINMQVDLNGLILKNPVTVASGTFGFGEEYEDLIDLNKLGAISVKGLTLKKKEGNPSPRLHETTMGLLNSIGLQNPGVEVFIEKYIPYLRKFDTKIIANINGSTVSDYVKMAKILDKEDIDSIEVNISCPNVKDGGLAFGTNPRMVQKVVSKVRKATDKHMIVKLSPNVTDIKEIAKVCEQNGANAISLINTVTAMAIDIDKREAVLSRKIGGLSGPAIKPIAIKNVYEVFNTVDIPVLGMGGIINYKDAVEFILAGASAIAVGTGNFIDPNTSIEIIKKMEDYVANQGFDDINKLVGNID